MKRTIRKTYRYLRTAPWPHGTALVSVCLSLFLGREALSLLRQNHEYEATALALWAVGWLVVALFAGADGIARHREYTRIRDMLLRHGFNRRILLPLASSRCQRDAALRAASEIGCLPEARHFFHSLGYRWYHILPDSVMRNPLVFLSPRFLRSSFLPGKKSRRLDEPK